MEYKMVFMAKKIADATRIKPANKHTADKASAYTDLLSFAMTINDPEDFYHGHRLEKAKIPDNILLFVRTRGEHIGATKQRSFHNRNVLLIPLRGTGRVIVNAHTYALEVGSCLHIPPYHFHHYSDIQSDELCWLFITFENVDGNDNQQGGIFWPVDATTFAADLRQLILTYLSPKAPKTTLQLACRLALLLANLQLQRGTDRSRLKPNGSEDLLLRVHALLSANLHRILSIAEISSKLGMSESSLRSQFRNASGYSLGKFQQTLHLQQAALLLHKNPHMSVSEVAAACGWDSPYAFSRAFSKYWDQPPKRFSRQTN
jgi:AraC family transcriptional regulator